MQCVWCACAGEGGVEGRWGGGQCYMGVEVFQLSLGRCGSEFMNSSINQ